MNVPLRDILIMLSRSESFEFYITQIDIDSLNIFQKPWKNVKPTKVLVSKNSLFDTNIESINLDTNLSERHFSYIFEKIVKIQEIGKNGNLLKKRITVPSSSRDNTALPLFFFETKTSALQYWDSQINKISVLMDTKIEEMIEQRKRILETKYGVINND